MAGEPLDAYVRLDHRVLGTTPQYRYINSIVFCRILTMFAKSRLNLVSSQFPRATRAFHTQSPLKMPDYLTKQEVDSKTDPSVAKQWDDETPKDKQWEEFYAICDGLKIGMLGTARPGVGVRQAFPVSTMQASC